MIEAKPIKPTNSPSPVCHIDDIPEGESKSLHYQNQALLAVKKDQCVYLYLNQCPHIGLPLEWLPDQFLTRDKTRIQCSAHGALFEIETGQCIAGPCQGEYLKAFAIELKDGFVFLR